MTVTKQQQLEWLANKYENWPGIDEYVVMNSHEIGIAGGSHYITREEWQQERDKMQKQQDNSRHERGEFPPAGSIVTVANDYETHDISDYSRDCIDAECVVMAVFERDNGVNKVKMVCVMEPNGGCYCFRLSMILPLRTEREKAIDEMMYLVMDGLMSHEMAKELVIKLHDSGYRKVKP